MLYKVNRVVSDSTSSMKSYKYMDMARWILSKNIPITSKELALEYAITVKQALDMLHLIKKRTDVIVFTEIGVMCGKKMLAAIHITEILPIIHSVDRDCLSEKIIKEEKTSMLWRFLLCR